MKKLLIPLILFLVIGSNAFAARTLQAHFAINASATAGNLNAGGFNPYNANFPTDLATTNGTSATPQVSAAYAFTAGDVTAGAWVYVKSGTNWIQGFYQITSQSGGVATLDAAIGHGVIWNATLGCWTPSTAQGVATQDTPGGNATYGVDYSQSTAAPWAAITDLASTVGTTNPSVVTSATVPFGTNHIGNFLHVTAGTNWTVNGTSTAGLQSWYEIVSVSGGAATLSDNQAVGTAATLSGGTFYIGGAFSLASSTANRTDDAVFELGGGTNGNPGTYFWVKNGTYTGVQAVAISATGGTQAPAMIIGYNAYRGDNPTSTNRPTFDMQANVFQFGTSWEMANIIWTGSSTSVLLMGNAGGNSKAFNFKITNTSTIDARNALSMGNNAQVVNYELISYRGRGAAHTAAVGIMEGGFIHDCDTGILTSSGAAGAAITHNVISSNVTAAITTGATTSRYLVQNNTLYGSANTTGIGVNIATGALNISLLNNIIYGFVTGVTAADTQYVGFDDYNNYFNNDALVSAVTQWQTGPNNIAVDPAFTNVTQLTGTGASSSTNVLTMSGATDLSGVVAGRDHIYLNAGSGTGFVTRIYGITVVNDGADTLTLSSNITSSGAGSAIGWQMTLGNNFLPTATMAGFPGAFQGGFTTGNLTIGGVQKSSSGSSSSGFFMQ